jgi:DNA-binding response OmpR family regulator
LQTIWGYTGGVRTRTLDVHVQRLRRKVRLFNLGGEIQTVLRHGYCWVPLAA